MLWENAQFSPSQLSPLSSLGILTIFSGGDPYRYLMLPFLSLTIISTQPDILPISIFSPFLDNGYTYRECIICYSIYISIPSSSHLRRYFLKPVFSGFCLIFVNILMKSSTVMATVSLSTGKFVVGSLANTVSSSSIMDGT